MDKFILEQSTPQQVKYLLIENLKKVNDNEEETILGNKEPKEDIKEINTCTENCC